MKMLNIKHIDKLKSLAVVAMVSATLVGCSSNAASTKVTGNNVTTQVTESSNKVTAPEKPSQTLSSKKSTVKPVDNRKEIFAKFKETLTYENLTPEFVKSAHKLIGYNLNDFTLVETKSAKLDKDGKLEVKPIKFSALTDAKKKGSIIVLSRYFCSYCHKALVDLNENEKVWENYNIINMPIDGVEKPEPSKKNEKGVIVSNNSLKELFNGKERFKSANISDEDLELIASAVIRVPVVIYVDNKGIVTGMRMGTDINEVIKSADEILK